MRFGVLLLGIVVTLLGLFGVTYLARDRPRLESVAPKVVASEDEPVVSPTGPHPKAVVDQTEFNFGRMEIGDEQSHEFTIRNDGEVPLKIKKGMTTCQCTISDVPQNQIPPGGSAKVKLTWVPAADVEMFEKGAEILTNDPDNNPIKLKIIGIVVSRLSVFPQSTWAANDVREESPTEIAGYIASTLDKDFQLTGFECSSPVVSARFVEVEQGELDRLKGLAGYKVLVTLQPEMPVGPFAFPLKLLTNLKDRKTGELLTYTVNVTGYRRGPLRLIGKEWIEDHGAVLLGSFDASAGKKVSLTLLAKDAPEEGLQFQSIQCEPEILKVTLTRDEKAAGALHKYRLSFEYPADGPRVVHKDGNPAVVTVTTNHATAREIRFELYFTAY